MIGQISQNQFEQLKDLVNLGRITVAESHVEQVRIKRVMLVSCRIPADVRKALNDAVKTGKLGHKRKNGERPEVYYHPAFDYLVAGEINKMLRARSLAVAGVCGNIRDGL